MIIRPLFLQTIPKEATLQFYNGFLFETAEKDFLQQKIVEFEFNEKRHVNDEAEVLFESYIL